MTRFRSDPKLERLYEQAALWLVRKEDGELNPAARRRYERWLELPGHVEAMQLIERFSQWLNQTRRHGLSAK